MLFSIAVDFIYNRFKFLWNLWNFPVSCEWSISCFEAVIKFQFNLRHVGNINNGFLENISYSPKLREFLGHLGFRRYGNYLWEQMDPVGIIKFVRPNNCSSLTWKLFSLYLWTTTLVNGDACWNLFEPLKDYVKPL